MVNPFIHIACKQLVRLPPTACYFSSRMLSDSLFRHQDYDQIDSGRWRCHGTHKVQRGLSNPPHPHCSSYPRASNWAGVFRQQYVAPALAVLCRYDEGDVGWNSPANGQGEQAIRSIGRMKRVGSRSWAAKTQGDVHSPCPATNVIAAEAKAKDIAREGDLCAVVPWTLTVTLPSSVSVASSFSYRKPLLRLSSAPISSILLINHHGKPPLIPLR